MSAFVAEKQKFLRGIEESDDELVLQLELHEANKCANELCDHKKKLKATMFDNKLASFNLFPSMTETCLGELKFAYV